MPFDAHRIEVFEGDGAPEGPCRIGDVRMWATLDRLQIEHEVPHPFRKGRFATRVRRSIFTDAAFKARDAFVKAGALAPVRFGEGDVKVQEYPDAPCVVFVFRRRVAGKEMLVPVKYDLGPDAIGFLRVTGRWSDITRH
jgi:hypothetical protein